MIRNVGAGAVDLDFGTLFDPCERSAVCRQPRAALVCATNGA